VSTSSAAPVFVQIDAWFARAPEGLSENEVVQWVHENAEIACPVCGDALWVMRTKRAEERGVYHLAMCQNPACTFQADD
jgi:predicted RNA-binding Zn-ribbon protein involved in translation (DUF1610 family)